MTAPQNETAAGSMTESARLDVGSWTILVTLAALLGGTGLVAYLGWILAEGAEVTTAGYVSMALGVILSLAVGFGLMGLVFYSSRRGYDESPVFVLADDVSPLESSVEKSGDSK